jgi:hypothetical protein
VQPREVRCRPSLLGLQLGCFMADILRRGAALLVRLQQARDLASRGVVGDCL